MSLFSTLGGTTDELLKRFDQEHIWTTLDPRVSAVSISCSIPLSLVTLEFSIWGSSRNKLVAPMRDGLVCMFC